MRFIRQHLGRPIASAAVLGSIGNRFRREVKRFAGVNEIPVLRLKGPDRSRWDDRKLDHVRPYLQAAERERRFGVVAIVAGQEFAWVFSARTHRKGKALWLTSFASSAASASITSTSWTPTSGQRSSRSARTFLMRLAAGSTVDPLIAHLYAVVASVSAHACSSREIIVRKVGVSGAVRPGKPELHLLLDDGHALVAPRAPDAASGR